MERGERKRREGKGTRVPSASAPIDPSESVITVSKMGS